MPSPLILVAIALLIGVLILLLVRPWARPAPQTRPEYDDLELSIDINALPPQPVGGGPGLTFYGAPVRIAVLVVAPAGREGRLPASAAEMARLLEHWLPGVQRVIDRDQPIFRRWPGQLSTQGFQQAFFHNLSLPGDRGRGTPWCSACGPFVAEGRKYLVGVVCQSEGPNTLGELAMQRETQWLEVLKPG